LAINKQVRNIGNTTNLFPNFPFSNFISILQFHSHSLIPNPKKMKDFNLRIPTAHSDKNLKVEMTGSLASLTESERQLSKFIIDEKPYFVLTQSDIDKLENGNFGVKGYAVWVFENEAKEENNVGKMINIGGKEPQMEAKEEHQKYVFIVLDVIREWLKK